MSDCKLLPENEDHEVAVISESHRLSCWIKAHQTELIVAGVMLIGTVLIAKNWASIKELFKSTA